ncbi:MAG: SMC-Scp complex subunit ScpB [Candidatus Thorarchaeota archaeon]
MDEETRLVEAALYISGRPLSINEIQKATEISTLKRVREIIQHLIEEYKKRTSALEIIRLPRQRFVLQLDPELSAQVGELAPEGLLSLGELKTLIYIALSQPILQSNVVIYRGSHSYKHIKTLESHGFIEATPVGRTKELVTTEMFADYFGFDNEIGKLKVQLRRMIRQIRIEQSELATASEDL